MFGSNLGKVMEFPADITWKVIGEAKPELESKILNVLKQHKNIEYTLSSKKSKEGKWLSYSIPMHIESAEEMEKLYKQLSEIDIVKMVI